MNSGNLIDQLSAEADGILQAHGIRSFGSYGFVSAYDCDPDMLGFAMWNTESPGIWRTAFGENTSDREFSPWQKLVVVSGADFEGFMMAARLSIGFALLRRPHVEADFFGEDGFYEMQLMSSMMTLGAAADRLRDLFIAAVFRQSPAEFKKRRPGESDLEQADRTNYRGPFSWALERYGSHLGLANALGELLVQTERIHLFRWERNRIVHDIATMLGKRERDLLNRAPEVDDGGAAYAAMTEADRTDSWGQFQADRRERIAGEIEQVIGWFKLLIETANNVFLVEGQLRRENAVDWP